MIVGVDLGGTKVSAAAVTETGEVGALLSRPTPATGGPEQILDAIAGVVREVAGDLRNLEGVGIATAGTVDPSSGLVTSATDILVGWAGTDVAAGIRTRLSLGRELTVRVRNDVDAYAIAESWIGACRTSSSALVVAVGTGVGGAFVLDGEIRNGAHGSSGEIGHIPVQGSDECACGALGHLEAIAAGPAIMRRYRALGGDPTVDGGRAIARLAAVDDPVAIASLRPSAHALGKAIAGLITSFDPECVVIGGGVSRSGAVWWHELVASARAELLIPPLRNVPIVPAQLGEASAIIGAARVVWQARERVRTTKRTGVAALAGGLIVSCQAYPGEPLRAPGVMSRMAQAAAAGGAVAVRLEGIADISDAAGLLPIPIIGIRKVGTVGVMITPTLDDAVAVAAAGADIVAIDGTSRPRPDGLTLTETIEGFRASSDALLMADCGSVADAVAAAAAGVDFIGTTLAGYSGDRPAAAGPDLEFVREVCAAVSVPVIAEGRIRTPEEASAALAAGAYAVCVGTAITHPTTITSTFVAALAT